MHLVRTIGLCKRLLCGLQTANASRSDYTAATFDHLHPEKQRIMAMHEPHKEGEYHFATRVCHVGQEPEQWDSCQVVPPISTATTYMQKAPAKPKTYDYGRAGNPTRTCLEKCLASVERAEYCCTFSSGMACVAALTNLLKAGEHVLCCDDVYGGTGRYFRSVASRHDIKTDFVDMLKLEVVRHAFTPETKMVWIETPTNPLLKVIDVSAVCSIARELAPEAYIVVDNTFMTPYYQRPLLMGADVSLHSITKYLNGHADVVMGCAMTNRKDIHKHMEFMQLAVGAVTSPFDCYLVNRGLKTLHLRMEAHYVNAVKVATFLEADKRIERVLFPAFPSHPQHAIHRKQTSGMSGMVSFYLKGGLAESETFLSALKLFLLAESLGGHESLAELPSKMTHASVPEDHRAAIGITDNLIRLSVGLEHADDLVHDLDQALTAAVGPA